MIHEFQPPDDDLGFSGERYVPSVGDKIQHEHYHRYLFALGFCEGKDVLDLACGEGYGTALIGTVAKSVQGVDSSPETIEHARRSYGTDTVAFTVGDALSPPLKDDSVDVVVCFETLEHVDDHDRLLAECARVLRPGGTLVLSTPDRDVYSAAGPHNEFHLREVNSSELRQLLARRFEYCAFGGQRSDPGSAIVFEPAGRGAEVTSFERVGADRFAAEKGLAHAVYLIALASDAPLPQPPSSLLLDGDYLPSLHDSYRGELEDVWRKVRERDDELAAERERRGAEVARLEELLAATNDRVSELNQQLTGVTAELSARLNAVTVELEHAYRSISWRLTRPLRVGKRFLAAVVWRLRTIVRLRTRLQARREHRSAQTPPSSEDDLRLLTLPGPGLPANLSDEAIVREARRWTKRVGPGREPVHLTYRPLVSLLMPTYETPLDVLHAAVTSVLAQTYSNWELVVVDDGSTSTELHEALAAIEGLDPRIRVHRRQANGGISEATNTALAGAAGEFVAMLDHDDELLPNALLEVVQRLEAEPTLDVVYTDQEYIHRDGTPDGLLLKPDWAPTLFWGVMFVGHLLVVRRSLAREIGGFDSAFDNVQDFEFMLRLSERTDRIAHVPRVLYRWRRIPGSVAFHGSEKSKIELLQSAAVTAHLTRIGVDAVARPHRRHAHRTEIVSTDVERPAAISLVLAGTGVEGLDATLQSLLAAKVDVRDVTVASPEQGDLSAARGLVVRKRDDTPAGDVLLCVEPGLTPDGTDWLADMLLYTAADDVAAVSAVVLDREGRVEQAGAILGVDSGWEPALAGWDPESDGYAGSLSCAREVSALYGSWATIERAKLERLGGFAVGIAGERLRWLELSLRASRFGFRNIVTPRTLVRRAGREPLARADLDERLVRDRWASALSTDPFHNANFQRVPGGYVA